MFGHTKRSYKAIIFDFYGVVCALDVADVWAEKHGISPSETQEMRMRSVYRADRGLASSDVVYDTFGKRVGKSNSEVHEEWLKLAGIDTDMARLILLLKKEYKIALCSNAFSFIRDIFGRTNVDKLFDTVVISSEVGFAKPEPEIFEYTLAQLDVMPQEAIFIDDNERFVAAAQELGITGIHFTSVEQLRGDLAKASVL